MYFEIWNITIPSVQCTVHEWMSPLSNIFKISFVFHQIMEMRETRDSIHNPCDVFKMNDDCVCFLRKICVWASLMLISIFPITSSSLSIQSFQKEKRIIELKFLHFFPSKNPQKQMLLHWEMRQWCENGFCRSEGMNRRHRQRDSKWQRTELQLVLSKKKYCISENIWTLMIVARDTTDLCSISADNEGDFHAKTFAHDSGVNIISWLPNSTFFYLEF